MANDIKNPADNKMPTEPAKAYMPNKNPDLNDPMRVVYDSSKPLELPELTKAQFSRLSSDFTDKHTIFYTFWQLGNIRFSTALLTAAVSFTRDGESVDFTFHPEYWNNIDQYTRQFVICHECLHVALKHGLRMIDTINPQIVNMALDIVVNHALVNRFGFDRNQINGWRDLCWVDTCFPGEKVPDDKFAEYYINEMKNKLQNVVMQCVDDHGQLGQSMKGDKKQTGDKGDGFLKKVNGLLSQEEKRKLKDFLTKGTEKNDVGKKGSAVNDGSDNSSGPDAQGYVPDDKQDGKKKSSDPTPFAKGGTGQGNLVWTFPPEDSNAKKTWVSLVKKWTNRNRHVFADSEQWVRINRRSVLLNTGLFLPSEMETEDSNEKKKIKAWFFLDTSGSCASFRERFWKAVETVPRKYFDPELYTFDTSVYPIIKRELRGGGGTSFKVIEEYIQVQCKRRGIKYPTLIIVITDGEADQLKPEFPKRWNFIMPQGGHLQYIPKESWVYDLETFE